MRPPHQIFPQKKITKSKQKVNKSFPAAHEQGLTYGEAAADIANDNMAQHIAAHINALEASTTHEQLPKPHRC